MRGQIRCLLGLLGLFYFVMLVGQAAASGFNTATVPVADYSPAALEKALPQALSQVLTQASSNPLVSLLPVIHRALPMARQWVQSYSYQTVTDTSVPAGVFVQVTFDQQAVQRLLNQAHQSVVGKESLPINPSTSVSTVALTVLGVNDLSDYSAVVNDLQHLPSVSGVIVSRINDQTLFLQVEVSGGAKKLVDTLDSDSQWVVDGSPFVNDPQSELRYRWVGDEE